MFSINFLLEFAFINCFVSFFIRRKKGMQQQRDNHFCACCNALFCKLSAVLLDDFQRKNIQQRNIWSTEQSPQILQFDFDSYKQKPQQDDSFQILHFDGHEDAEKQFVSIKQGLQCSQTVSKTVKNSHQIKSNAQIKFIDSYDFYGPAGQIQSILNSQFINLQQMKEEIDKGRLSQKDSLEDDKSAPEKNTNMPKFLLRLFFRHYRQTKAYEAAGIDQSTLNFIKNYQQRYLKEPKSFYKLDQLIYVLRLQEWIQEKNIRLRKIMNAILRAKGRLEILKSSQIKLKTPYLTAAKVYSLRCANASLSQRLQSK